MIVYFRQNDRKMIGFIYMENQMRKKMQDVMLKI